MTPLKRLAIISFFSFFISILVAKAATPYLVSSFEWDDHSFPLVQAKLNIEGDVEGFLPKHISIEENEKVNVSPLIFLPPHPLPQKIELNVLLDTSKKNSHQGPLIQSKLRGMIEYLFDQNLKLKVRLSSFQQGMIFESTDPEMIFEGLKNLAFLDDSTTALDGFEIISKSVEEFNEQKAQKVMLILSGTRFLDQRLDGVTGLKTQKAVASLANNKVTTFFMGHPFPQFYGQKPAGDFSEWTDFSHQINGGYVGGFGSDLTAVGKLLLEQSEAHFLLQYYSQLSPEKFYDAQVDLFLNDYQIYDFKYGSHPTEDIVLNHFPDNEIQVNDEMKMSLDIDSKFKSLNAVELFYKNKEGVFSSVPFVYSRHLSSEGRSNFSIDLPPEVLEQDYFSYYLQAHTPYESAGDSTPLFTLPVNFYDLGITLTPTLLNEHEVLWQWSGPTVGKGEAYELWFGDQLLTTTDQLEFIVPVTDCDRYQIMQLKVIFPDKSLSHPSRPSEFYVSSEKNKLSLSEKEGVERFLECLDSLTQDTYIQAAKALPKFNASRPLTLERASFYLAELLEDFSTESVDSNSGYFSLIFYLMNFINKEQYLNLEEGEEIIPPSILDKLISKVNHTDDLEAGYLWSIDELSARLRGQLSI